MTRVREMAGTIGAEAARLGYLDLMDMRAFSLLLLLACLCSPADFLGQGNPGEMLEKVYGVTPERPAGYTFTKVIHYDLEQLTASSDSRPPQKVEGAMDLYYSPGQNAYARVVETEDTRVVHIGDLDLGMRYSLTDLGDVKIGGEGRLSEGMKDTLIMSRVSGDREIDGRMSAHFWYESGTLIDELWADSQASEEEVTIGRLWPRFEPGFASLAIGTYVGLATRWVSIDTEFSREPRVVLDFKGAEALEAPLEISFEGFIFPVSEADMMRKRLEAERQ